MQHRSGLFRRLQRGGEQLLRYSWEDRTVLPVLRSVTYRDTVNGRIFLLLVTVLLGGCSSDPQYQVVEPPLVPFEELFVLEDTIRLDPSVIIGRISFMDTDPEGNLLITDSIGDSVFLFSSTGEHIRTYDPLKCLIGREEFSPWNSLFMSEGKIMTTHVSYGAVVFNPDGSCFSTVQSTPTPFWNSCVHNDSLYYYTPIAMASSNASLVAYSSELVKLHDIPVKPTVFPVLNDGRMGILGRSIACFDDGPYFAYQESVDAMPAYAKADLTLQRPKFFVDRPRDLRQNWSRDRQREEWNKYPSLYGVFALTPQTRMVTHFNLWDRWRPAGLDDQTYFLGIGIVSNTGQFLPRSIITTIVPIAAGHGYMYERKEHELLPDGELGNRLIIKYRFVQPENTDD
jgi:hypothetical protein